MDFFYRKKPWYAGQFVRKIIPKINISGRSILFIQTLLNLQKSVLLQVLVRDVDKTFRNMRLQLPQNKNGEINFTFMEDFVRELEAYLLAAGLIDYNISSAEQVSIDKLPHIKWQFFNVQELFGRSTRGKRLKGDDRIPGSLPFVTAGEADTGISAFIGNKVEVFAKNTTTIDMFGSAKYRNYDYGADDHVAVVHTEHLPKNAAIFVAAACHKAAHTGKFNYGHNFYAKDADELNIMLPVKNGVPDYAFMETIISAVHKLVIKDVVLYADRRLAATKQAIEINE